MPGKFGGAAHRVVRHGLPKRDGGGVYRRVTDSAVGRAADFVEAPLDPGKIVSLPATDAAGVSGIAVKLDDVLGREARYLMQIVDVLGDDSGGLAGPVERGERAVTASRPRRGECRLHRQAPSPCLIPGLGARDEFIVAG